MTTQLNEKFKPCPPLSVMAKNLRKKNNSKYTHVLKVMSCEHKTRTSLECKMPS